MESAGEFGSYLDRTSICRGGKLRSSEVLPDETKIRREFPLYSRSTLHVLFEAARCQFIITRRLRYVKEKLLVAPPHYGSPPEGSNVPQVLKRVDSVRRFFFNPPPLQVCALRKAPEKISLTRLNRS